jgi:hypothetical protein
MLWSLNKEKWKWIELRMVVMNINEPYWYTRNRMLNPRITKADVSWALPQLSLLNETQIELLSPVALTLSEATASCEVRGFISLLTSPCEATWLFLLPDITVSPFTPRRWLWVTNWQKSGHSLPLQSSLYGFNANRSGLQSDSPR